MPKMSVRVNGAHASDLKAALCGFQPACLVQSAWTNLIQ